MLKYFFGYNRLTDISIENNKIISQSYEIHILYVFRLSITFQSLPDSATHVALWATIFPFYTGFTLGIWPLHFLTDWFKDLHNES